MHELKKVSILIVFLFSTLTHTAFAANWYIDRNASGSNGGSSWADAWQSFSAINWGSISPGDIIYISGGSSSKSYNETLNINASGSSNNSITIKPGAVHPTLSSGHDGMVIIGSGASIGINYRSENYVTVDGNGGNGNIKIRVTGTTDDGIFASNSVGIKLLFVHVYRCGNSRNDDNIELASCQGGSEIAHCNVEDPYIDGIKVSGHYIPTSFGNVKVHHNWIHGMADDGVSGDGSLDFYNNIVGPWGNWGEAGHPDGMQMYAGHLRIYNNLFFTNFRPGASNSLIRSGHPFGDNHNSDQIYIYNNIFMTGGEVYDGRYFKGIEVSAAAASNNRDNRDGLFIINNTFVDVGSSPILIASRNNATYTNFIVKNNIIYNCRSQAAISVQRIDFTNSSVDIDKNTINRGVAGGGEIYWNNRYYTINEFNSSFGKNNIDRRPTFVNYSPGSGLSNDLHLSSQDTSSLDSGVDLSSYINMDKDGNLRPQGNRWDIGAYEYPSGLSLSSTIIPALNLLLLTPQ